MTPRVEFELAAVDGDDTYEAYDELRRRGSIVLDGSGEFFIVVRGDTLRRLLREESRYLRSHTAISRQGVAPPVVLASDGPTHERLRTVAHRIATGRSSGTADATLRETVRRFSTGDAISLVAAPIALAEAARLLVGEGCHVPPIRDWASAAVVLVADQSSVERTRAAELALVDASQWFISTSSRVKHHAQDAELSDIEQLGLFLFLLAAGSESTINAVASLLVVAARHELLNLARAGENPLSLLVNEALRLETPVQGLFRKVHEAIEFEGVFVPAGARLLLSFGSANRDGTYFERPQMFEPGRPQPAFHFGMGRHRCAGRGAAESVLSSLLQTMAEEWESVTVSGGQRTRSMLFRGYRNLSVEATPRK